MFLIMQLNLTCRKYRVQSPTRKEGWDLFRRTSEKGSAITLKEYSLQQNEEES